MSFKVNKKVKISGETCGKNDEELKPMSYYVDDRLELVKQIFSTLKPKTIKSLSPEFLKESTIEEIQEMCLNELLGISSKRLKSIIFATKCPTDTESSDSNVDENISLEEISSDSEDENQVKRKKVKSNKFGKTSKDKSQTGAKNENGKEISVLELLELQARARAIRSQLALEPITKVELDDSEDSGKKDNVKTPERKSNQKYSKNHSNALRSGSSNSLKSTATENLKSSKIISTQSASHLNSTNSKPIKLKRNFAKPSSDSIPSNYCNAEKNNHNEKIIAQKRTSIDKIRDVSDKIKKEIKDHKRYTDKKSERSERRLRESTEIKRCSEKKIDRSPSPDVLAILPSPEILSVSDSSDDDKQIRIKKEKLDESESESDSSTQSSNTTLSSEESDSEYSNNEKTNPEKMEDLRNLIQRKKIREKENEKVQATNGFDIKETKITSGSLHKSSSNKSINKINDCEKSDQQNANKKSNDAIKEKSSTTSISQEKINISMEHGSKDVSFDNDNIQNIDQHSKETTISNSELEKSVVDCEICKVESEKSLDNSKKHNKQDEDNHNDDVISLGDAELDYGINDHIEERTNSNINIPDTPLSPEVNQSEPEEGSDDEENDNENENIHDKSDFIDLHDSSGEEVCNEENNSWNDRWLKSSKVSKILAASKLGNKVRDKVKKSNKAEKEKEQQQQHQLIQQEQLEIAEKLEIKAFNNSVLLNFEEGSVKQYEKIKEIIKSPKK